jgi:hypothetical protein
MNTSRYNIHKEACDARNALRTAVRWCFETVKNPEEHLVALSLKDEALNHMLDVCGEDGTWIKTHEEDFHEGLRMAYRYHHR